MVIKCVLASLFLLFLSTGCRSKRQPVDNPALTPLMNAAAQKDAVRVQQLIKAGASVNAKTLNGVTALYEGIERYSPTEKNEEVVKALLAAGADPNEGIFEYKASPLGISISRDYANPNVTLLLLKAGASVQTNCDESSRNPMLAFAIEASSVEVAEEMIHKGAPVNCRDNRGESALFRAARVGSQEKTRLLLQAGADPQILSKSGQRAVDVASDDRVRALLQTNAHN